MRGLAFLVAISGLLLSASADELTEAKLDALIADLDHAEFARREAATQRLAEIGTPAFPALREALKSESPELRSRAGQIFQRFQRDRILNGFALLGAAAEVDVEQGMFLIALMLDPEVTKASIDARLDALAESVREKLEPEAQADPAKVTAHEAARVLVVTLRDEIGLHGDRETYDHPDNSSIHRVLEQKDGLPILLAEIAVAVGRRAELDVHGLLIPGYYKFMCHAGGLDDVEGPEGLIINPYGGWMFADIEQIERRAGRLARPDPKAVLARMLNNLESDFIEVGDSSGAALVVECRALLRVGLP